MSAPCTRIGKPDPQDIRGQDRMPLMAEQMMTHKAFDKLEHPPLALTGNHLASTHLSNENHPRPDRPQVDERG